MKQKHLISLKDYSREDIEEIFDLAARVKADPLAYSGVLQGQTLGMIFQKPSTRTRVSFEVGMFQLGGHALFLGANDIQLNRGESVARHRQGALPHGERHHGAGLRPPRRSRTSLAIRTVPVINGLSDLLHPCQALADYFTLLEKRGALEGLKIAYVGDGNNVCNELMFGAVKLGMRMSIACPKGYEPHQVVTKAALREAQRLGIARTRGRERSLRSRGRRRRRVHGRLGVHGAGGRGREAQAAFAGYQVTEEIMAHAAPDALFMHCLPAHRGEEVAAEVIDGPQSVVFDEAENRLHTQKAVMMLLMAQQ